MVAGCISYPLLSFILSFPLVGNLSEVGEYSRVKERQERFRLSRNDNETSNKFIIPYKV
jgi:hypothetical protein